MQSVFFTKPIASQSDLENGFICPPLDAKPRAYWVWVNGNVSYTQLTRDLEEIKDKGLGGFDIFDIGARDPQKIVPEGVAFFGPESLDAIGYAARECERLGLELGVITSSSWNAGGPWIPPELGTMGLFLSQTTVEGPGRFSEPLPVPTFPEKAPKNESGLPVFNKTIAVLAIPDNENRLIENKDSILNLTDQLASDEKLEWNAPAGTWRILRFVCACTGERLVLPSPKSNGLIIDHFNADATEFHFQYLIDKLQQKLGDLENSALKIMYLPSYEVTSYDQLTGLIWTPKLQGEFKKRRGYDLDAYLPALFGWTLVNEDYTDRFRFDFNMTLSDLIIENHYQKAREICNRHGLVLCSEAGGPGQPLHNCPFEALRALGSLDIPRGEFWYKHQRFDEEGNDILWLVKEIACASHIYGKTLVDGEAFTSWHHWQIGPFDLKPLADRAMAEGLNRFTFHTSPHSPPEAGKPGWVYHAGTHIGSNRVWWPKAKPFIDYLARSCFLLQQGRFVADVLYYYGDEAPNFVKPKRIDPSLGYGYDYDVVNSEVILTRMDVKNGKIVLPDGMSYELLVLPERADMNPRVLQKLEALVKAGATVVGQRPTRAHGLTDFPKRDEQVNRSAERLWGDCDGLRVKERQIGAGRIIWGKQLKDVLLEKNIGPDFQTTDSESALKWDWIHRRTEQEDIYFVYNTTQEGISGECTFRVKDKIPELWYTDSGEMRKCAVYKITEQGIQLPLSLPPSESVFVVFKEGMTESHVVSITKEGDQTTIGANRNPTIEVCKVDCDALELLIQEPGVYTIETSQDKKMIIDVKDIPEPFAIDGAWEVRFPFGWGAPPIAHFPTLISWTASDEEGIQYFSGIATYYKDFEIPDAWIGSDYPLVLDLGKVKEVADVFLNGHHVGIVWKPPFQLDITEYARPGSNRLVVEVANLWSNRLVGDAKLPNEKRFTSTNMTHSLTWQQPWSETPLLEAGLIGPVRVLPQKIWKLSN
jgi:hypothetical protein